MADILKQMARLQTIYGTPRDRTETQLQFLAAEWLRALGHLPASSLGYAIDVHTRKSKFWPTIAEIVLIAAEAARELRDEVYPDVGHVADEPAERTPEEVERRKRVVEAIRAAVKRDYPHTQIFNAWADEKAEPAPASQGGPSEHLINSKAAQRARESAARKAHQQAAE